MLTLCRIPFSVFPSAYKNEKTSDTTEVKTEEHITVQGAGREEQQQPQPQQSGPSRHEERIREDIRITTTEEDRRRPARVSREEEIRIYENDRRDTRREDRFEERREDRFDTRTENRFDNQRFDSRVDVDIQQRDK